MSNEKDQKKEKNLYTKEEVMALVDKYVLGQSYLGVEFDLDAFEKELESQSSSVIPAKKNENK